MKKIITIAGKLGSGKSTTAKKIAKKLGFEHFSSGDFLREVARKRNMSIKDLMLVAETNSEIDVEIDTLLKSKKNSENLIIDSRLAFHWIPDSFKVYLDIDPYIAAKRMYDDSKVNPDRRSSETSLNLEEMRENMIERHRSDVKRYEKLYGIDHTEKKHFDLVINTGKEENSIDMVTKKILEEYKNFLNS